MRSVGIVKGESWVRRLCAFITFEDVFVWRSLSLWFRVRKVTLTDSCSVIYMYT
jgi:hypothetical protein